MKIHLPAVLSLVALAACDGDGSPFELDNGTPQTPTLRFGETKVKTAERPSVLGVPVTLSFATGQTLFVPFTLEGSAREGLDFVQLTPSPLEIPKGELEAEILFQVFDDGTGEVDESLRLELGETVGAKLGAEIRALARIEDNDQAEVDEVEPNDDLPSAQDLGFLRIDQAIHVRGQVQSLGAEDSFDVFGLEPFSDQQLRFALDVFNPTGDMALRVLDEGGATLLLLDAVGPGELEEGVLEVPANAPVFLEVTCANTGTDYLLQVAAEPLDDPE